MRSTSKNSASQSRKETPRSERVLRNRTIRTSIDPELINVQEAEVAEMANVGGVPPPPDIPIDPMMLPRGLPIVVPQNLPNVPIPANLPRFAGTPHEDPAAHIERFEELLTSNLIVDHRYYMVWFPITLAEAAYSWY